MSDNTIDPLSFSWYLCTENVKSTDHVWTCKESTYESAITEAITETITETITEGQQSIAVPVNRYWPSFIKRRIVSAKVTPHVRFV